MSCCCVKRSVKFKGRIAYGFRDLFPRIGKQKDFLLCITNYTLTLWKDLWTERNEVVHGVTKSNQLSERTKRVHAELHRIYSRRHLYLEKDKDLLFDTVEEHINLPVSSIRNWLNLYKNHFTNSAYEAKKYALQGVAQITNYFHIT